MIVSFHRPCVTLPFNKAVFIEYYIKYYSDKRIKALNYSYAPLTVWSQFDIFSMLIRRVKDLELSGPNKYREVGKMKKVLIIIMIMAVASLLSCSGDKEKSEDKFVKEEKSQGIEKIHPIVDPVSGEKLDPDKANYHYDYKGVRYVFNTKDNLEKFKKNPEKYIEKIESIDVKPGK